MGILNKTITKTTGLVRVYDEPSRTSVYYTLSGDYQSGAGSDYFEPAERRAVREFLGI